MRELIIDSFAGGGGTSTGIETALGRSPDIALNHDRFALAMHRANHPGTLHVEEDVVTVDSIGLCAGRPVGLFWLSPDCKHHSKAKGGKPREKNIRGLAWTGFSFVKSLPAWQRPRVVILENVEEFAHWGPLLADGKPCPDRKGQTFQSFVAAWGSLGYVSEHRELRACDYGAPTIRKRLFWIARRDGRPIVWPNRSHGNPKDPRDAVEIEAGRLKPWRTAAEIIDWSLPCPSIFETSAEIKARFGIRANRPLAEATMARIAKGTMRYVVQAAQPFIVQVNHGGGAEGRLHSTDEPAPTLTGKRGEAIVAPFASYAQHGGLNRDIAEPVHTLTASRKDQDAVVSPFITKFNRGATGHEIDQPLATVTAHASETHGGGAAPLGIVAPILVGCGGRAGQTEPKPADEPVITQTAKPDNCIVAPCLVRTDVTSAFRRNGVNEVGEPVRTQTTSGSHAVIAPLLVRTAHGEQCARGKRRGRGDHSVEHPAPTVLASNDAAVVAAHLMTMRNSEKPTSAPDEPTHTITAEGAGLSLVSSFLAPRYGERPGQEPRTRPIDEPAPVIVPTGNEGNLAAVHLQKQYGKSIAQGAAEPIHTLPAKGKEAVVAAFLAQHNTGLVGHDLRKPVSTLTTGGQRGQTQQAVVAAHLTHAYTSNTRGGEGDPAKPLKTVVAGGNHAAAVYAFLAKYYGEGLPSQPVDDPMHTVTAKPRHGLVTVMVSGEPYVIVDIGMRMLTPRERFLAQGFPPSYKIDEGVLEDGSRIRLTLEQQGRMCGNSVSPVMAAVLVGANYVPAEMPTRSRRRASATPLFLEAAE